MREQFHEKLLMDSKSRLRVGLNLNLKCSLAEIIYPGGSETWLTDGDKIDVTHTL